jgi:hypothetical protein
MTAALDLTAFLGRRSSHRRQQESVLLTEVVTRTDHVFVPYRAGAMPEAHEVAGRSVDGGAQW